MATISSAGIGSGLDVNSIITQLIALERRPINQLQTQKTGLTTQLSSYGRIQSSLDTLRTAARSLTESSTWTPTTATSSDTSAVGASTGTSTSPGSYSVQVTRLAASQLIATSALPSASSTLGQGTLHIELGAWDAGATAFTPKSGGSVIDIAIGAGQDTLEGIRDQINGNTSVGVRASIVTDNSGARLVLTSASSGETNGFRLTVTDADAVDNDNAGLSRLAYDPAGGAGVATRTQAALDASALINGLTVLSSSNTLSNVIDGVTLTLAKITVSPVEISINRDSAAMRKSVETFASAYNDVIKLLRDQTKYDPATKTGGPLQGDRAAVGLEDRLRTLLRQDSSASSVFVRASDIGLDVQTDGSIKTNTAKLDAAIVNVAEIKKFFTTSGGSDASDGLGIRSRNLTDSILGIEGPVATRKQGLQKRIDSNVSRQEAYEQRVLATEARLRAQYTALDRNMAQLSGLQGYVTQQVANWNRSSSN